MKADPAFEFDGEKYKKASKHQKEWGTRLIKEFSFRGDEKILDLGCGDGVLTAILADAVPNGYVTGIDASKGMIEEAIKLKRQNLNFLVMDINHLDETMAYDLIFSNAALHWVKNHAVLLQSCKSALKQGGIIRFNFAGKGNCSNFFNIVKKTMEKDQFKNSFSGFVWPWYMPDILEYKKLMDTTDFKNVDIWEEKLDTYFENEIALANWIKQPSIVPFLACLDENTGKRFSDLVINKTVEATKQNDGRFLVVFNRINIYAKK